MKAFNSVQNRLQRRDFLNATVDVQLAEKDG
jgi:hypothetical protein